MISVVFSGPFILKLSGLGISLGSDLRLFTAKLCHVLIRLS